MYVLTDSNKVIVAISSTLSHQDTTNYPLINNGTVAIGFPVNEYEVESVPDGVGVNTHCYDGSEFTYNKNYPFEREAIDKRSSLLSETDWTQTLDAPITKECSSAFRTYRQALRDITEQEGYPYTITWPEKPEVVKGTPDPVDVAVDILIGGNTNA